MDEKNFKEGYTGIIKEVNLSVQGYHTGVLKNGNEVILDVYRSCLTGLIREGDSLRKEPNSWKLFIYRQKRHGYELIKVCDQE